MALKKDGEGVIRLGNSTSHGGVVISVAHMAMLIYFYVEKIIRI